MFKLHIWLIHNAIYSTNSGNYTLQHGLYDFLWIVQFLVHAGHFISSPLGLPGIAFGPSNLVQGFEVEEVFFPYETERQELSSSGQDRIPGKLWKGLSKGINHTWNKILRLLCFVPMRLLFLQHLHNLCLLLAVSRSILRLHSHLRIPTRPTTLSPIYPAMKWKQ